MIGFLNWHHVAAQSIWSSPIWLWLPSYIIVTSIWLSLTPWALSIIMIIIMIVSYDRFPRLAPSCSAVHLCLPNPIKRSLRFVFPPRTDLIQMDVILQPNKGTASTKSNTNLKPNVKSNDKFHTGFFNCSSYFSEPKWKMMGRQSEILFHEIFNVQKILFGWITFFFLALKYGQNS